MLADLLATLGARLQCPDSERVTKLVPTRAAIVGARDFRGFRQFLEGWVNIPITQRPAILSDERIFPAATLSPANQVTI